MAIKLIFSFGFLVASHLYAASASITINSSVNPSLLGEAVAITASINPALATGSVTFYCGSSILGTRAVANGAAALNTSLLPSGTCLLTAHYNGDGSYSPTVSTALKQTVQAVAGYGLAAARVYPMSGETRCVVIDDFNGDGNVDIAVGLTAGSNSVTILLGKGDGTFKPGATLPGNPASCIASGDFNGDGIADLAAVTGSGLNILIGLGDGTFRSGGTFPNSATLVGRRGMLVADFNGDGKADIATLNSKFVSQGDDPYGIGILLGYGDGTFQPEAFYPTGRSAWRFVAADLNKDGAPDLAAANQDGTLTVLINNRDGTFQPSTSYPLTGVGVSVAAGDFDEDGKVDLAVGVAGFGGAFQIATFHNDGTGKFSPAPTWTPDGSLYSSALATGDFNGDGHLDLVLGGSADSTGIGGRAWILTGDGTSQFRSTFSSPTGDAPNLVLTGDFNRDGLVDIVTPNLLGGSVSVLTGAPSNALMVSNGSIPDGMAGVPYTFTLAATGGVPPYAGWTAIPGSLPSGFSLDSRTGQMTGTPTSSTGSPFTLRITVRDATGATSTIQPIAFVVADPVPIIAPRGVTPIFSTTNTIAPGEWISIFGTNLASATATWAGDYPTSLGGVSVTINGKPGYLAYVSPTQINMEAPDDSVPFGFSTESIVVSNSYGKATGTANVFAFSPSMNLLPDGEIAGVILTPDGSGSYGGGTYDLLGRSGGNSFPTRPVRAGETLVLSGTGFGDTIPKVPAGRVLPTPVATSVLAAVSIGGVPAKVTWSGVVAAGVYQFNIVVPNGPSGGPTMSINLSTSTGSVGSGGYRIVVQ